jgi:hypothetical protein
MDISDAKRLKALEEEIPRQGQRCGVSRGTGHGQRFPFYPAEPVAGRVSSLK